jgi:hypothetical protein
MSTLYHVQTLRGLYSIALDRGTLGYSIREYKHGNLQGCASLGNASLEDSILEYNRRISDAAKYDQIYYVRKVNPEQI